MYEIIFTPRASREFKKLTLALQERLAGAIDRLEDNPRPPGTVKLRGQLYRIRMGDWRIIYEVFDKENLVIIVKVVRRSENTYRDLDVLV